MHHALGILELVEMVCYNLGADGDSAYGTLAALALTCRSLQDPALDALWSHQESLIPILSCMPADIFNVRPPWCPSALPLRIVRPLAPTDWKCLLFYSRRVRTLETSFESALAEIYPILSLCLLPGTLFPNLRSLSWYSESDDEFLHIQIFLTSTIVYLDLTYEPSATSCSLLSILGRTCPHLTDLGITLSEFEYESDLNCTAVSIFTLPDIPHSVLPRHASSRILENFIWSMGSYINLESLILQFNMEYSTEESTKLYIALTVSCSLNSLTRLHLRLGSCDRNPSAECTITDGMMRILFYITKLTSLQLTSAAQFTIHDGTILDAAQAWPCLEDLTLDSFCRPLTPPLLTVESIYSLAQHCPRLRSLHLTLNATSLPAPRSLFNALARRQNLRRCASLSLQFRGRAISRAEYCDDLTAEMQANYERWKEVEGLVPEFVAHTD
ncbi:hypothetical protein B0H16DRAFT_1714437 [Mycena metata]|uniref:F-box domain-containing protein n=1 Tax=Mycena metata TaxID=1033252 RepID=A0AAD7JUQ0_9AGAR|nr:hypothetical protein B0H16DRAFT_1714437 [Mycena metata]